jgi:hypothetical protein
MINPSPIILHPAAHRLWLMFESTYTSALAKQDRSHVDPLVDFCAGPRLPFLQMKPFRSPLHFPQTLVANTGPTTDQQSSLQSP